LAEPILREVRGARALTQSMAAQIIAASGKVRHMVFFWRQMSGKEIGFNTNLSEPVRTRADFTYNITPATISITDTGLGSRSVTEDIEAVLRKIEHWHQGSIAKLKIMCRDGKGFWHRVRRDGKTVSLLALQQTDSARSLARSCSSKEN
jgi:hypothetical protein